MERESLQLPKIRRLAGLIIVLTAVFSVAGYLIASAITYRLGFPLDDAWIHQTYARNLAMYGEWAFIPHQQSGGSTAPLWSVMLVPGYLIGLAPLTWAYLLGTLILVALGFTSESIVRRIQPDYAPKLPWVGIFMVLEWHLVWAAASGMETLLSALLATVILGLLAVGFNQFLAYGLLIGISVWVRPDAVTLLGPVMLVIGFERLSMKPILSKFFRLMIGFGLVMAFYSLFNLVTAGTPFPNTYYAKQAEYAVLQEIPFITRWLSILVLPITGAGVLLIPGAVAFIIWTVRNRKWGSIAGVIWFLGYLCLYAWRLPVTYQHGRYIMPAMPIFFIWGLVGMYMLTRVESLVNWRRIIAKVWIISTAIAVAAFWILGARGYALDTAVIESEMVETAFWVSKNVPAEAVVAAHDIGALGYFAPRNLVDLAGLVSPEIISIIQEEEQIAKFMDQKKVDFLITFPDWYPTLVRDLPLAFSTNGQFTGLFGKENMTVYYWSSP